MGTKITHADGYLSGFILPWSFSSTLAADHAVGTDYTEADPEFGAASYSGDSRAVLVATGTPSTGTTSVDVRAVRGGMPDGEACGVVARVNGLGDWYGRDKLTMQTGYQYVSSGYSPRVCVLASERVIMVSGALSGGVLTYYGRYRDPDTGTWSGADVIWTGSAGPLTIPVCAVCTGPDGGALAYLITSRDGSTARIDCYRTASGASWVRQADDVSTDKTNGRWDGTARVPVSMHAASVGGSVVVGITTYQAILTIPNYWISQWYSGDGGYSLIFVSAEGGSGADRRQLLDLRAVFGAYVGLVSSYSSGTSPVYDYLKVYQFGTPAGHVVNGASYTLSSSTANPFTAAILADESRAAVLAETYFSAYTSTDFGSTWSTLDHPAHKWWIASDPRLAPCSAVFVRGEAILLCEKSTSGALDDGIYEVRFGGTSSLTWPDVESITDATYGFGYLPTMSLNTAGWVNNDTGAPARTLSASTGQRIQTGVGVTARNELDYTTTTAGLTGYFTAVVRVASGDNSAALELNWRVPGSAIQVLIGDVSIEAHDATGSAGVGQSHNAGSDYIEVRAVVDDTNSRAYVWWRVIDIDAPGFERAWNTINVGALGAAGNDVRHRIHVIASGDVYILSASVCYKAGGSDLSNGIAYDEHQPVPLSAGTPARTVGGMSLTASSGPVLRDGLDWTIPVSSAYRKANLLPGVAPSPRMPWRSGSTASTMWLEFTPDPGTSAAVYVDSDTVGIWLGGLVGVPSLDLYNDASLIAALDFRIAIAGQRTGPTVRPAASGSTVSGRWVAAGELVGGYVDLGSGDVRKITANTSGSLTSGTTVAEHRAVLTVEGIDGTEASSGTFYIWPPSALIVWHLRGATVTRLRLKIASTVGVGPEGYRQIGTVCAGPIAFLGRGWDRQTAHVSDSGREIVDLPDLSRSVVTRGPTRRRAEVAIVGTAIDVTQISRTGSPDYVVASSHASSLPSAARWGDPLALEGLVSTWFGEPLVWLPSVPIESGAGTQAVAYTERRCRDALYGRITSTSIRREWAGVGKHALTEMYRIPTLVIEEEP